tara:strand:+ start:155 stop:589 length:435 start_codon:yes stop_codon:yes gene_type:complete
MQRYSLSDYDLEVKDGEIILTKKKINVDELISTDLVGSKVLECSIFSMSKLISKKTNIRHILNDVWYSMDINDVLKHSAFSMKNRNDNAEYGYLYDDKLKLFIKGKNINDTMTELLQMIKLNKYFINISIKLKDSTTIKYTNIV